MDGVIPSGNEIHVDMITDAICPWCYIGKRRMEAAFSQFPEVRFTVDWLPYILPPPDKEIIGKSNCLYYSEYLTGRYGEQQANQMLSTLIKAGESVGIHFDHARPVLRTTIPSHILVQYAKRFQMTHQATEAVMKAYFEEGRDVADVEVLVEIAESLGLNPKEARHVISDRQCHQAILKMSEEVKNTGVKSVPTYVVTRKGSTFRLKFSGAQTPECFNAAIRQVVDPDLLCLASNLPSCYECGSRK
jgi:predicted DsbA family dithiol-disulfide isomerase